MKMCHHVIQIIVKLVCGVSSIPMVLGNVGRAVTHARIRITDIMGGAIAMSFGKTRIAGIYFIP